MSARHPAGAASPGRAGRTAPAPRGAGGCRCATRGGGGGYRPAAAAMAPEAAAASRAATVTSLMRSTRSRPSSSSVPSQARRGPTSPPHPPTPPQRRGAGYAPPQHLLQAYHDGRSSFEFPPSRDAYLPLGSALMQIGSPDCVLCWRQFMIGKTPIRYSFCVCLPSLETV